MKKTKVYHRLLNLPSNSHDSFFLFGPRGTGKTTWLKEYILDAIYIDLLKTEVYSSFLANPSLLEKRIPSDFSGWIIIDEIQKVPSLLNEVHRLIESYQCRFILTGSSACSLRKKGVNLLAGRALDYRMHPLTYLELGKDFDLSMALKYGLMPAVYHSSDPKKYLSTYISSYLREEVQQEGLVRNLGDFARFLETASFSQGEVINLSDIARDAAIERRVVSGFFNIVEDLLIGLRLPVFAKRAKRRLVLSPKFYYFDAGIYRTLRPKGPLDSPDEIDGPVLETLFLEHLRAYNDYFRLNYDFYFWRTSSQLEVDFVAYGEKGLIAFEIKRKRKIKNKDLRGLQAFAKDYDMAELYLIYGGDHEEYHGEIKVIPFERALALLPELLHAK